MFHESAFRTSTLFKYFTNHRFKPKQPCSTDNRFTMKHFCVCSTNHIYLWEMKAVDNKNEKRKWQVAFRRFVLEGSPSEQYAPYFGLHRKALIEWFESQFTGIQNWENFGSNWQFEHVIPVSMFDTSLESELKLCWSYLNIRVASLEGDVSLTDLSFAKAYFEKLYTQTGFPEVVKFLTKIESITKNKNLGLTNKQLDFIQSNMKDLQAIPGFTKEEYAQYLETESAQAILTEREILKKFG